MRVEKGRQSNHTSFIVPPELGDRVCSSLREYVAQWLLLHRRYVCCDHIAHSFGISRRQASNVIYSIYNRHADVYRCSIRRVKEGKGNVVKTWLRVDEIILVGGKTTPPPIISRDTTKSTDKASSMATLFLRRRMGEMMTITKNMQ